MTGAYGLPSPVSTDSPYERFVKKLAPVSVWFLNEASGGRNWRSEGSGPDQASLFKNGTIATATDGIATKTRRCLALSAGAYLSGTPLIPTGSAARSALCWFKTTSTGKNPLLGWGTSGGGLWYQLELNNSGAGQLCLLQWSGDLVVGGQTVSDGVWHLAAAILSGGTSTLYLDGVAIGTLGAGSTADIALNIGRETATGTTLAGAVSIASPMVFDKAITQGQLALIYALGRA